MVTTLYVIRHGETLWNVEGRYQGQLDPPLNERGLRQARRTAEALKEVPFEAIYSSDLKRAVQTARALAEVTGLPVRTDTRLREIHQGEWQGVLTREIRTRWPEESEAWESDPWACCPPGGETLQEVQQRLLDMIEEIKRNHPSGSVAIVTHRLPIALFKIRYLGHAPEALWSLQPANAAWEIIELSDDAS